MFEELAQAIRGLDLPNEGTGLAALIALRDQLDARIAEAVGHFDADMAWAVDGAVSTTGWLKLHGGLSGGRAAGITAAARRLHRLPVTLAAWRDGRVSSGQIDVVMAGIAPHHTELWAEHEAGMVPALVGLSVTDTQTVMREWANRAEALISRPVHDEPVRHLSVSRTLDNRHEIKGHLDGDGGVIVTTALRVAATQDPEAGSPGERRADGLVDICKFFLDHQTTRLGGSHRPHVNVVVTHDELGKGRGGRYDDGTVIGRIALDAVLCDCNLHRLLVDQQGAVIDYGTGTRTISPDLRAALVVRDQGCRFPGCDRPATWADGHHVRWWRHGGRTGIDNLVLLCRAHHRTVHKPGWRAELRHGALFEVTDPNGRTRSSRPPGQLEKLIA